MEDYLNINKKAYEDIAEEFEEKIEIRKEASQRIAEEFDSFIKDSKNCLEVLELGPGSGDILKNLYDKGYKVTALEFSPKMAEVIKRTCPESRIIVDDFISYNFGEEKFQNILAIAFIHLFPEEDCILVLEKIRNLLKEEGVAFISTTLHENFEEGYFGKTNFKNNPLRYRRRFTEEKLDELFKKTGFKISKKIKTEDEKEVQGKKWISYILE
jgi:SAM-dependent methyltransferase